MAESILLVRGRARHRMLQGRLSETYGRLLGVEATFGADGPGTDTVPWEALLDTRHKFWRGGFSQYLENHSMGKPRQTISLKYGSCYLLADFDFLVSVFVYFHRDPLLTLARVDLWSQLG